MAAPPTAIDVAAGVIGTSANGIEHFPAFPAEANRLAVPWIALGDCGGRGADPLISGELYHDLGPDHFDHRANAAQTRRLVTRLQNLGFAVQITPLAG